MDILILDDHALFRNGLNYLLRELDDDVLIHEYSAASCALRGLKSNSNIKLVLLDLSLPDIPGFEVMQKIRENFPDVTIVVVSASTNISDMKQAFHLGARGYIIKSETPEIMLQAIKLVLSDGVYIPAKFSQYQENYVNCDLGINLTPKQVEVLKYIQVGISNKQIADHMNIAINTIKVHTTAIYKELGVTNRTQAVILAKNLDL